MSTGLRRAVVMGALALCLGASPARAQDALDRYVGRRVTAVELQIEGRPETSPTLLALVDVDIKAGDVLTVDAMKRVGGRLSQVPRVESVRVLVDDRPSGLVLIFSLEPTHPIDRLEISGDSGVPAGELDRLLREQFNGLPTLTRLGAVEDAVRRFVRNEGYRAPQIQVEVVQFHDPDRATLAVRITAGPRTTVSAVDVRGRSPLLPDRLITRLQVTPGSPFRERALAAGLAEIRDELRAQGYYTAIAQFQPTLSADESTVSLVLTVDAGPLVELVINGELPGKVDELIPIKVSGSVDSDLLDDSRAATESTLRKRGYWHARVEYTRSDPSPERLVITFNIMPGKRYRVMRVDLPAGLQITAADVNAQSALKTGAWFSEEGALNALLVLKSQVPAEGVPPRRDGSRVQRGPGALGDGGRGRHRSEHYRRPPRGRHAHRLWARRPADGDRSATAGADARARAGAVCSGQPCLRHA